MTRVRSNRLASMVALVATLAGCAASVGPMDGRAGDATTDVPTSSACRLPNGDSCPAGQTCPAGDHCNRCTCSTSGALTCTSLGCTFPDVQTEPPSCSSTAECSPGQLCVFRPGCDPNTVGHCVDRGTCDTVPTASSYCDCDGATFVLPNLCPPDHPFATLNACPDRGADSTRFPNALMAWQAPGGFAGTGPAVVVTSDGTVRIYRQLEVFDPTAPLPAADSTLHVSIAESDDLFMRWFNTSTPGLPHLSSGGGDCYPSVYTRLCGRCTPRNIQYHAPAELLPEMDNVWRWFDEHVPDASPRGFCG